MSPPVDARALSSLYVIDVRGTLHALGDASAASMATATFTTLLAPDRRPHPFCARSLLTRIDARACATGARVAVSLDGASSAFAAPLAVADALVRGEVTGGILTLRLVEDVDEPSAGASLDERANVAFGDAIECAADALAALAESPVVIRRVEAGAVAVEATKWLCGPHILLATIVAAGTRPQCSDAGEPVDVDALLRALLGDPVMGARAMGHVEFPRGVLPEDVSFPPR